MQWCSRYFPRKKKGKYTFKKHFWSELWKLYAWKYYCRIIKAKIFLSWISYLKAGLTFHEKKLVENFWVARSEFGTFCYTKLHAVIELCSKMYRKYCILILLYKFRQLNIKHGLLPTHPWMNCIEMQVVRFAVHICINIIFSSRLLLCNERSESVLNDWHFKFKWMNNLM